MTDFEKKTTKALPCPFCGGSPEFVRENNYIVAKCSGFGCYAERKCISALLEDAIDKWNERT